MACMTAIVLLLALYGLLSLLTHAVPSQRPAGELFGGVIDTRADRSLGCLHPELRERDRAIRGAVASAIPTKEPT